MTYAEGLYRRTHKKEVESTEDYLNRVTNHCRSYEVRCTENI